ncbi:MAG TPA: hypothetical protein VKS21_02110 [Spirochaetota bacterium]|nr:hypothetical protein [Spirochaetota bacterium]
MFFYTCRTFPLPDDKDATPADYVEVAQKYSIQKSFRKAIDTYKIILNKFNTAAKKKKYYEDIAWAYYEIGFCYLEMKEYKKAKKYFNIVMTRYSTISAAYTLAQQRIIEIKNKLNPQ